MRNLRLLTMLTLGVGGALASLGARGVQTSSAPPQVAQAVPQPRTATVVWQPVQPQGRGRANLPPPPPLVATGILVGKVIDAASGQPVAGATVTLSGGPTRTAPAPPGPGVPAAPALPPPPPPRLLTDAEGRFAFRNLTRGNYQIAAEKPGYASGAFGRARPNGPTRPMQLDDHERMVDVAIRVFKLASISGLVSDERGEPIVNAPVRAYRRALVAGRRVLTQAGQVQTDDRGMYRLFNLTPAEYVIAVPMQSTSSPSRPAGSPDARQNMSSTSQSLNGPTVLLAGGRQLSADGRFFWQSGSNAPLVADGSGRWRSYATTYYPASPTIAAAEPIVLASGDEKVGVDVLMRYVPVSDVSGVVFAPDGPASNYVLRLVASDTGEMTSIPESATAVADANGAFTFLAVPAGQYVIQTVRASREALQFVELSREAGGFSTTPVAQPTSPPPQPLLWALTPISVGDVDVAGLSLTLREGLTVSGRLEFTGSRPRPSAQQLSQIPLVVEPASGRDNTPTSGPPSRVQPDGRFVTAPRMPGKYFLRVGGQPAGFIVQSVTVNGVDATESPFELSSQNLSNVVVTFTDLISTLGGTVRGTPPGADPPAVVVFPADSTAWKDFGVNPARIRMTRAGATGTFNFGSLINGHYFVTAIHDEFSSEWQDPAFLEVLSHTAQRLTVGAGEKRTIDVPLSDARPPSIRRAPSPMALSDPDAGVAPIAGGPFVDDVVEAGPQNPVRDARAPTAEPVATGSISGLVTVDEAGSPRPGRLARVTARGGGLAGERSALTDDDGRFTIPWLPAGEYTVMVTKPSYLTMYHGARRPEAAPGTPVRVEAGKSTTGANVTLWRGAVVTGIVLDPLGQPAPNVRAQLQQYVVRNGERILASASAGGASTDDRGAYRIYGVRPGAYVLSVTPPSANTNTELRQLSESEIRAAIAEASRAPTPLPAADVTRTIAPAPPGALPVATPAGRRVSYSPIYFPGTSRPEEAAEIVLTPGQEVNATIQIHLVPAARLEGRVVTPDGQTPANAQITLQRMAATQSSSTIGVRYAAGLFQAISVPVGRYSLNAWVELVTPRVPGAPAAPSRLLWAQQTIDVTGGDLMNLVLTLGPPIAVSGRVVFDSATRPDPKTVQVRLESAGLPPPIRMPTVVSPDATGAFTITGVAAGRYRLIASVAGSPTQTWSLLASAMGGRDTIVTPLDIRGDESVTDAVVTLTDRPAEVSGTLLDAEQRPVPGMIVVLFSADRETWVMNPSRVNRMSTPSTDGTFRFSSTLPGEYYLAVVTAIDNNEWNDPAVKEQLAAAAIKVSVAKGEKKVQDLRVK